MAPGVRWLRMALPFALDHINLWLLRDERSTALRKAGRWSTAASPHDATRAAWEQIFATQLEGLPVLRVIVTHMHPDHIGLAALAVPSAGTRRLWISATDYHVARAGQRGDTPASAATRPAAFFAAHGLADPDAVGKIARAHQLLPRTWCRRCRPASGACSTATRSIGIGGRAWRCITRLRPRARAHRAALRRRCDVLISGDMVLPRISTNVSVHRRRARGRLAARSTSTRIERMRDAAGRHAGAALARQAVHAACTPRIDQLQDAPPRPPGRSAGGLRARRRTARPSCCRCCSSASSTCTR